MPARTPHPEDHPVPPGTPGSAPTLPVHSGPPVVVDLEHTDITPGDRIADRYRIVTVLGRGGMGEVYRADDLTLDMPVALKFLPPGFSATGARLDRLRREVRIARKVTHANVCRVFDIVEVGRRPFIVMEYIDGEDLASLLRRIGRLPTEKCLQIASQVCLGLAAAHEQGVIHRDLKPSNVMIDGRGHARITDFGIAGIAEDLAAGKDAGAGTPAYMAPEQLLGQRVTERSDLYSLGLLLYELFTGKPAHESLTLHQRRDDLSKGTRPPSPSQWVPDLDPVIEEIILRCLEDRPERRPESAWAVLASLPGEAALGAVRAAGQTPSPELVAGVGAPGSAPVRTGVAALLLAAGVLGVLVAMLIHQLHSVHAAVRLDKAPAVLLDRAVDVARRTGVITEANDIATGLSFDVSAALNARDRLGDGATREVTDRAIREQLAAEFPASYVLWARLSPSPIVTRRTDGEVEIDDPPLRAGEAVVSVSQAGHLVRLRAVPRPFAPAGPIPPLDPEGLLTAAGLDRTLLAPAEPLYAPPSVGFDERIAFTGTYPGLPTLPLRVEIASLYGRPVAFTLLHPWDLPDASAAPSAAVRRQLFSRGTSNIVYTVVFIVAGLVGLYIAQRELRQRRGDHRGALRLAAFVFTCVLVSWVILAHHSPDSGAVVGLFIAGLGLAGAYAALHYGLYIALEPAIRRRAPELLVSWARLVTGRRRDPLVGRDILVGIAFAAAYKVNELIAKTNLDAPWQPGSGLGSKPQGAALQSVAGAAASTLDCLVIGTLGALITIACIAQIMRLSSRRWVAVAIAAPLFYVISWRYFGGASAPSELIAAGVFSALALTVAFRFGLLALAASFAAVTTLNVTPGTLQPSAWYFSSALLMGGSIIAVAFWAFRVAVGAGHRSPVGWPGGPTAASRTAH